MENFEDPNATAVARVTAAATTHRLTEFGHASEVGFLHAESLQGGDDAGLVDGRSLGAIRAQATDEALGDNQFDGGAHEEWLHAHVDQTRDGARGVVGVERREHEVTRE